MEKRTIKTTINQISKYWNENSDINETDLNFDWADAKTQCWNCGDTKGKYLQRCHIIPHSLGGKDEPSNYVLLCSCCHTDAPNILNKNAMWEWIKSNYIPFSFYNTYRFRKGLVEFKTKEGYSFFEKIKGIDNISEILVNEYKKISTHGIHYNSSTYYFMFKKIIEDYGLQS